MTDLEKKIGEIKVGYPDCCYQVGNNWFRYRAAAIIIENGCLLAVTNSASPYYYSVGGGVHMNEKSDACVHREVKEETGVDYEIDRLAVVCENLFTGQDDSLDGMDCHVLEFYYLMKSRGITDLKSESYGWNNTKEELVWIPLEQLPETNILPEFLQTRIPEILKSEGVLHIINDER